MRALERYVAQSIPERVDDVAVQGTRGFTFNGQILESVAQSGQLGPAGATGIGEQHGVDSTDGATCHFVGAVGRWPGAPSDLL